VPKGPDHDDRVRRCIPRSACATGSAFARTWQNMPAPSKRVQNGDPGRYLVDFAGTFKHNFNQIGIGRCRNLSYATTTGSPTRQRDFNRTTTSASVARRALATAQENHWTFASGGLQASETVDRPVERNRARDYGAVAQNARADLRRAEHANQMV